MAGVKHTFSTAIADDASALAAGMVLPSHWNAEHTLSGVAEQSAVDVLSIAVGALSAQHTSLAASVAGALSAIGVNSAQMTSADNAISAAVNIVSNALSNELSVRAAADTSLAGSIANAVSAIAANSAQMTSADNAISAAVVVVSAAHTSLAGSVAGALSAIVANSAQMTSADNAISNAVSIVSNALSVAAQGLSLRIDSSFAAIGLASNYASVASNAASVASNAASIAVQAASVASAAAAALPNHQIRIVSNTQSTNGSALVDISGLVLTVAADETWELNGLLLVSTSVATTGLRAGFSVPPLSLPRYAQFTRVSQGQSAGIMGGGGLLQVSGNSVLLSLANLGGVLVGVPFYGVFNVASAGTVRVMYGGIASTAASPIHIMAGSYLKAVRLK